jgi:hypothetical protein
VTEEQFSQSRKGQALIAILQRPGVIDRIVAASRADRPAVEAIDAVVADEIGLLSDPEKQAAGRVMKRSVGNHGLRPVKKGQRVRGGRVFSRGTVYREIMPFGDPAPFAAAAVAAASPGVDRFQSAHEILVAGRRDPAMPLADVDAFLRERRAMWGEP